MLYHKMKISGIDCSLPICKISDDLYIGAFVIWENIKVAEVAASELLKKAPEYDYVITAEAKGIPIAQEVARQHGDSRYIVARKYPKLYMTGVFEVTVNSITTDKQQTLYLDTAEAELIKGKRILIVDDVISTGESLIAVEKLVEEAGGIIVGKMAILAEGDAQNREDIIYVEKLPIFDKNGNIIG